MHISVICLQLLEVGLHTATYLDDNGMMAAHVQLLHAGTWCWADELQSYSEATWAGVLEGEILVGELCAVDGLSASAITAREVASLHGLVLSDIGCNDSVSGKYTPV